MRLPIQLSKTLVVSMLITCSVLAAGKNKKKVLLADDVLQAKTVLVVIDPQAGMAVEDPSANKIARNEVESAILNWGRFTLASDVSTADLVIVVRKGNEKPFEGTIGGSPNNSVPVMIGQRRGSPSMTDDPSDPSRGQPTMAGDPTSAQPTNPAYPQIEAGRTQDTMEVYRGKRDNPLDSPVVWRYSAKNALESPGVPAVDAFKRLIAAAEKQQQQANKP